jgi:hypothetical protein
VQPAVSCRCLNGLPVATLFIKLPYTLNLHGLCNNRNCCVLCRRAVFEFGSKLPHTCDIPNTTYAFCEGRGCHIATRDIAAGELLTSCYMGHRYLLLDTYAR